MAGEIYLAKTSFWYHDDNGDHQFCAVGTRVREGHKILDGRMSLFKPDDVLEPERMDNGRVVVNDALEAPAEKPAPVKRPGRPPKAAE
ncbi:hypothetical protein [Nocardia jiangxiensis]|uniref:hypothetical protein n=1 Tax=Nocardia jiangxiensis TaxID=282685 RepID=UPI0002E62787|nr:hypothetical protein [Nocardia jiangxiensis]